MTGALPVETEEEVQSKKRSKTKTTPAIAKASAKGTSSLDASKQTRSSTRKPPPSTEPDPGDAPHQDAPSALSQSHQTPLHEKTDGQIHNDAFSQEDDSLSMDNLLSFGSLDSDSPTHGTRPPSAVKVGATPAHETSILALKNFKRRQRQPSLLRRIHQTTEVEDNDLDDLDDFNPEGQSTPLHLDHSGSGDESIRPGEDHLSSSASRGTKRKLSSPVVLVPRSSPLYDPPSGADLAESHRSSSPSLPEDIIETQEMPEGHEQNSPDIMSETMAPPRSSSPLMDDVENISATTKGRRIRGTRGPVHYDASGDEESQLRPRTRPKGRPKVKVQGLSTAKLQALLPRRRTVVSHEHDEYDLEDSDEIVVAPIDSDEDELQMPQPRKAAPTRKTGTFKPPRKGGRKTKKAAPAPEVSKKPRTYGRRTSSDKENGSTYVANEESEDDEVEDVSETRINVPKERLEAIAKKFEEVDAWDLEFETVDQVASSS
ncbi:hypothetical protein EJ04DRAFT_512439, partial [Polyplosphaeria fusca]